MQIKPAPVSCYRKVHVDETEDPEALRRLALLDKVEVMRAAGTPLAVALAVVEVTRSTYYRWRAALRDGGARVGRGMPSGACGPCGAAIPSWARVACA